MITRLLLLATAAAAQLTATIQPGGTKTLHLLWEGDTVGAGEVVVNGCDDAEVTLHPVGEELPLKGGYVRGNGTPWEVEVYNTAQTPCTVVVTEVFKRRVSMVETSSSSSRFQRNPVFSLPDRLPATLTVLPVNVECLATPVVWSNTSQPVSTHVICPEKKVEVCFTILGVDEGDFLNDLPCLKLTSCGQYCGPRGVCSTSQQGAEICSCEDGFQCVGNCDFSGPKTCHETCSLYQCPTRYNPRPTTTGSCEGEMCSLRECCTEISREEDDVRVLIFVAVAVVGFVGCLVVGGFLGRKVLTEEDLTSFLSVSPKPVPLREPLIAMEMSYRRDEEDDDDGTMTSSSTCLGTPYPGGTETPLSEHLASSMKSTSGQFKKSVSIRAAPGTQGSWKGSPHSSVRSTGSGNHLTVHKDSFRRIPRVTSTHVPRGTGRPPQHPSTMMTAVVQEDGKV